MRARSRTVRNVGLSAAERVVGAEEDPITESRETRRKAALETGNVSTSRVVPPGVPSVVQSSAPASGSNAEKSSRLPRRAGRPTEASSVPPAEKSRTRDGAPSLRRSATSAVPSGVPSVSHSSRPCVRSASCAYAFVVVASILPSNKPERGPGIVSARRVTPKPSVTRAPGDRVDVAQQDRRSRGGSADQHRGEGGKARRGPTSGGPGIVSGPILVGRWTSIRPSRRSELTAPWRAAERCSQRRAT